MRDEAGRQGGRENAPQNKSNKWDRDIGWARHVVSCDAGKWLGVAWGILPRFVVAHMLDQG
jgi:hypothetical protein